MVNNFNACSSFMIPKSEGDFWFGQIIARRKDIPSLARTDKWIKSYFIRDFNHLKEREFEIIKLCQTFRARFYLNPNVRDFERINLSLAQALLENIKNKQYNAIPSQIDSVCGCSSTPGREKIWVIDLDEGSPSIPRIQELLRQCSPDKGCDKIIEIIPTVHGYHLLTSPFNKMEFIEVSSLDHITGDDIKANSPTLIYFDNDFI